MADSNNVWFAAMLDDEQRWITTEGARNPYEYKEVHGIGHKGGSTRRMGLDALSDEGIASNRNRHARGGNRGPYAGTGRGSTRYR